MFLLLSTPLILLLCVSSIAAQSFCNGLAATFCVVVDVNQLDDSRNDDRVSSSSLEQVDDAEAQSREPGEWSVTDGRITETSGIRASADVSCPPNVNAFGSYLKILPVRMVGGNERQIRVRLRLRDPDGWAGIAFAMLSTNELMRVVFQAESSCFALQRRQNGGSFSTMAQGSILSGVPDVDKTFEVRVRYGGGFVQVQVFDPLSIQQRALISTTVVTATATALGGDVALYSSNNRQGDPTFEYIAVVDTQALQSVNEPKPITLAPTPVPTPVPTPNPTPLPPVSNCQLSQWSEWSPCSETCRSAAQSGSRSRTRAVVVPPMNGGVPCGQTSESEPCNQSVDCGDEVCNCVGCQFPGGADFAPGGAGWCRCCRYHAQNPLCSSMSRCTERNVFVNADCRASGWCTPDAGSTVPKYCGKDAFPTENFCKGEIPDDCVVSNWSEWSVCSRSCAPGGTVNPGTAPNGFQGRTRSIVLQPTTVRGLTGKACPTSLFEQQPCNTVVCPQDCGLSDWSEWSQCTATCTDANQLDIYPSSGRHTRTRSIVTFPAGAGQPCSSLREDGDCQIECVPDVDCLVTQWSAWSPCQVQGSCTAELLSRTGQFTRTRSILRLALGKGVPCPDLLDDVGVCSELCPRDCAVSPWGEWSMCTQSCGGGTHFRQRGVTQRPVMGGAACPALGETEACNTQSCVLPVDCKVGPWAVVGRCSVPACGGGLLAQERLITTPAASGGQECPVLTRTVPCNEEPCARILSSALAWRLRLDTTLEQFDWTFNVSRPLAFHLGVDENRFTLLSTRAGSVIVDFLFSDAESDVAANYAAVLSNIGSQQVESIPPVLESMRVPVDSSTTAMAATTRTTTENTSIGLGTATPVGAVTTSEMVTTTTTADTAATTSVGTMVKETTSAATTLESTLSKTSYQDTLGTVNMTTTSDMTSSTGSTTSETTSMTATTVSSNSDATSTISTPGIAVVKAPSSIFETILGDEKILIGVGAGLVVMCLFFTALCCCLARRGRKRSSNSSNEMAMPNVARTPDVADESASEEAFVQETIYEKPRRRSSSRRESRTSSSTVGHSRKRGGSSRSRRSGTTRT